MHQCNVKSLLHRRKDQIYNLNLIVQIILENGEMCIGVNKKKQI